MNEDEPRGNKRKLSENDERPFPSEKKKKRKDAGSQSMRPKYYPLSERQQMALLMQMTAEEKPGSDIDSTPISATRRTPGSSGRKDKVNKRNERGETPLHLATIRGDMESISHLVKLGADINVQDYAGWTPLHEACNHGYKEIAQFLLESGANVNSKGLDDDYPLHDAVINAHSDLVQLLLKHGANPLLPNKHGERPLDLGDDDEIRKLMQSEVILSDESDRGSPPIDPLLSISPPSPTARFSPVKTEVESTSKPHPCTASRELFKSSPEPSGFRESSSSSSSDSDDFDEILVQRQKNDDHTSSTPSNSSQTKKTKPMRSILASPDESQRRSDQLETIFHSKPNQKVVPDNPRSPSLNLENKPESSYDTNFKPDVYDFSSTSEDSLNSVGGISLKPGSRHTSEFDPPKLWSDPKSPSAKDSAYETSEMLFDRLFKSQTETTGSDWKSTKNNSRPQQSDRAIKASSFTLSSSYNKEDKKIKVSSKQLVNSVSLKSGMTSPSICFTTAVMTTATSAVLSETSLQDKVSSTEFDNPKPTNLPSMDKITPVRPHNENTKTVQKSTTKVGKTVEDSKKLVPLKTHSKKHDGKPEVKKINIISDAKSNFMSDIESVSRQRHQNQLKLKRQKNQKKEKSSKPEDKKSVKRAEVKLLETDSWLGTPVDKVKQRKPVRPVIRRSVDSQSDITTPPVHGVVTENLVPMPTKPVSLHDTKPVDASPYTTRVSLPEERPCYPNLPAPTMVPEQPPVSLYVPPPISTHTIAPPISEKLFYPTTPQIPADPITSSAFHPVQQDTSISKITEIPGKDLQIIPSTANAGIKAETDIPTTLPSTDTIHNEVDTQSTISLETISTTETPSVTTVTTPSVSNTGGTTPAIPGLEDDPSITEEETKVPVPSENKVQLTKQQILVQEYIEQRKASDSFDFKCYEAPRLPIYFPLSKLLEENKRSNVYEERITIQKLMQEKRERITSIVSQAPDKYWKFMTFTGGYLLSGSVESRLSVPVLAPPPHIGSAMVDLFKSHEEQRVKLRVQHAIEREKLIISCEQQKMRVHSRAARTIHNQQIPFSACSMLMNNEVYNVPRQAMDEPGKPSIRDRFNARMFIAWLQDVKDTYDKMKRGLLSRQKHEAEAMFAVQKTEWLLKLQELDVAHRTFQQHEVNELHVPMVNIADDFDLLPA